MRMISSSDARLGRSAAAWLRNGVAALAASISRAARARRDMRLLSEMNDRALRDIGLHRVAIEHTVDKEVLVSRDLQS